MNNKDANMQVLRTRGTGDGHTQPVVDPQVGHNVHEEDSRPADVGRRKVQHAGHQDQAKVGEGNEDGLAGTEDSASGLKVAQAVPGSVLTLLAVVTGREVEQKVHLPASNLVDNQLQHLGQGSVLDQLRVEPERGKAGLHLMGGRGARHKDHILLHVASEAVVAVVRVLP